MDDIFIYKTLMLAVLFIYTITLLYAIYKNASMLYDANPSTEVDTMETWGSDGYIIPLGITCFLLVASLLIFGFLAIRGVIFTFPGTTMLFFAIIVIFIFMEISIMSYSSTSLQSVGEAKFAAMLYAVIGWIFIINATLLSRRTTVMHMPSATKL